MFSFPKRIRISNLNRYSNVPIYHERQLLKQASYLLFHFRSCPISRSGRLHGGGGGGASGMGITTRARIKRGLFYSQLADPVRNAAAVQRSRIAAHYMKAFFGVALFSFLPLP